MRFSVSTQSFYDDNYEENAVVNDLPSDVQVIDCLLVKYRLFGHNLYVLPLKVCVGNIRRRSSIRLPTRTMPLKNLS